MQDLTTFLTRIQTFNFELVDAPDFQTLLNKREPGENGRLYYWLGKETRYWDSTSYSSEITLLSEMAVLNLCIYEPDALDNILQELKKIQSKFKAVWVRFHDYYSEWTEKYEASLIREIGLTQHFIMNNYKESSKEFLVSKDGVETISDSLKLRERALSTVISACSDLCDPSQTSATVEAYRRKQKREASKLELIKFFGPLDALAKPPVDPINNTEESMSDPAKDFVFVTPFPKITESNAVDLIKILLPYFPEQRGEDLKELILNDKSAKLPLIFNGAGNKLADAFKQLYEAGMVIGCNKNELEKWINLNFQYFSQKEVKEFSEGYLAGIISSDTKPCKSPILEVKQKDGKYYIVECARTKKNSKF
ncbi:MAG: hypothetical protein V4594_24640 [Bacteroidota bacterium]